ncbi:Type I restriction-modification system, DNA-methyltransferase subunit M [Vibrio casei]|nr:Type I restriction-modification system, DNA-methyltransferase subunit M [Vibrio casei]
MGSGGFFVQSEKFIERHAHEKQVDPLTQKSRISIYGQEYNHTTWQLAAMNMAIRGLDYDFGKEPASTYTNVQHPDLRADFIMANPPFNMKEWNTGVDEKDARFKYGMPPAGNANFAWMQHMLHHLAPDGSQALLLANGSMSSTTNNEGAIRQKLIEEDLIECMVALPGQLFTNTQIPACIWFLTKNKTARNDKAGRKLRARKGEVLFIDARNLGYMKDRVLRDFTMDDIQKVADLFHAWKTGEAVNGVTYEDQAGFCKSAKLEEIKKHDFVLTPGRYVGAADEVDDGIPFGEKMATLTSKLSEQFAESAKLEAEIKKNLAGLGYEL